MSKGNNTNKNSQKSTTLKNPTKNVKPKAVTKVLKDAMFESHTLENKTARVEKYETAATVKLLQHLKNAVTETNSESMLRDDVKNMESRGKSNGLRKCNTFSSLENQIFVPECLISEAENEIKSADGSKTDVEIPSEKSDVKTIITLFRRFNPSQRRKSNKRCAQKSQAQQPISEADQYEVEFLKLSESSEDTNRYNVLMPELDAEPANYPLKKARSGFFFFPKSYFEPKNENVMRCLIEERLDLHNVKLNSSLYLPNEENVAITDLKFSTRADMLAWKMLNPCVNIVVTENLLCPLEKCDAVFDIKAIFMHLNWEHENMPTKIIQRYVATRFELLFSPKETFEALLLYNETVPCSINELKESCTPFICKAVSINNFYGSYAVAIFVMGLPNKNDSMQCMINVQSNTAGFECYSKQLTNKIIDMHEPKDLMYYLQNGHALLLTECEIKGLTSNGTVPALLHVTLI